MLPEDVDYLTIGKGNRLTIGSGEFLTNTSPKRNRNRIQFNLEVAIEWTKEVLELTVRVPLN